MRPVDRELPRPERAEAFDQMLRHRRIVRVAAAIPAPRGEPPERLLDARDPGFLGAAGVAHQAVREQLGEALVEGARQRLDESRVSLTSTSITARSPSIFRPVEVSALRSHDSTSASSTIRVGQPGSIDRLQSFKSGR